MDILEKSSELLRNGGGTTGSSLEIGVCLKLGAVVPVLKVEGV